VVFANSDTGQSRVARPTPLRLRRRRRYAP